MELNRKVLVHCAEGKQRSYTVVGAYLIQSLGLTVLQANAYLHAKHPQTSDFGSGLHFEQALKHSENYHLILQFCSGTENSNFVITCSYYSEESGKVWVTAVSRVFVMAPSTSTTSRSGWSKTTTLLGS